MNYLETLAWVCCRAIGCDTGRRIDSRHLDNINASGGWHCPVHEGEVPC